MTDPELRVLVARLLGGLLAARRVYEGDQRAGVQAAIASLGIFVTAVSGRGGVANLNLAGLDDMLGHLGLALAGLDIGSVDPLLAPNAEHRRQVVDAEQDRRLGRKAGLSPQELMLRAVVAASLHGLHRAGHTLEAAASIVVKELKGSPLLARVKGKATSAVRRWRSDIMDASDRRRLQQMPHDASPEKLAVAAYNEIVESIEARLAAGAPKEMVAAFTVMMLKFGYGMPNSGFLPAKPERRRA